MTVSMDGLNYNKQKFWMDNILCNADYSDRYLHKISELSIQAQTFMLVFWKDNFPIFEENNNFVNSNKYGNRSMGW